MPEIKLTPIAGMNVFANDADMQVGGNSPRLFVRDAVNVDIDPSGSATLRRGAEQVSNLAITKLWQSPLHGDVFGVLGDQLVKVDANNWGIEVIREGIDPSNICYAIVNTSVLISTPTDIFVYSGGATAEPLTVDTPARPMISSGEQGQLFGGRYVVAIAWKRGAAQSGLSEIAAISIANKYKKDNADCNEFKISVSLPLAIDPTITSVLVYVSTRNGASLMLHGEHPIATRSIDIIDVRSLGAAAKFENLSPMPSGSFMSYWQGRLLVVNKNIIQFSQPMTYHLHDERHDFVMMPQRITFLVPVDGGVWVGQVDHVVFLSGTDPRGMSFVKKTSKSPVPNSAISLNAEQLNPDIAQGGSKTALWLAENGYVLGTSSGQVIEMHAGIMKGISAKSGTSVVLDRRVQTAVT